MIYFITIAELKKQTNINNNVNDNDVVAFLKLTYDKYLLDICGDYINELLIAYNAIPQVLTPTQIEMLKFVKDIMLWGTAAEVIMNTTFAVKNKGVVKQNGENIESVDYSEMGAIRKQALINVEMYLSRFEKWLCENDLHCNKCKCNSSKELLSMFFV